MYLDRRRPLLPTLPILNILSLRKQRKDRYSGLHSARVSRILVRSIHSLTPHTRSVSRSRRIARHCTRVFKLEF
ncbi:hypothetical protein J6590_025904 [Homalodisca vitripennis]|nr:hypothetical protein J6590_025904 [Homalodisca vitripennis]